MFYAGIDIGTTNTKAVLLDDESQICDRASLAAPTPDAQYQLDADCWRQHAEQILLRFAASAAQAGHALTAALSTQGGSFVLLDKNFQPIGPGHSWLGHAPKSTVQELASVIAPRPFYRLTGWEPSTWLAALKLKQLNSNLPNLKYHLVATVPDYIHARLAGAFVTDVTNAQITGLLDFQQRRYDDHILDWVGLSVEALPTVADHAQLIAEDLRIGAATVHLAASSHDQYAVMAAADLLPNRSVMLGTGTAWVLTGKTDQPVFDDPAYIVHPGRDLDPDLFGFIAILGSFGAGLEKLLAHYQLTLDQLDCLQAAWTHEPPAGPINVDPQTPAPSLVDALTTDADAGSPDITLRRYMQAAAARVAFFLEKTQPAGALQKLVMTGGAAASTYWPQTIANITAVPVEVIHFPEFAAYGAARLAQKAIGLTGDLERPAEFNISLYQPDPTLGCHQWYTRCQHPLLTQQSQRE